MAPRNNRVSPQQEVRSPARSFAQTLDNFYAPSRDRRSEQAFQDGVSAFSSIFAEKAARERDQRREDEYARGQADAMREAAGEEMKGVRSGSIFRQNSSFYMKGLNEQRGKAKGIEFRSRMAKEYEAWEGKNSDDPNDFRNFMNARAGEFIESLQGNPQMLNAALPYINEVAANTAASHTAYTNERLKEEQVQASHQIFGDIVAGFSRGDYDQQTAINKLGSEIEELYASGEKDARGIALDAMILEAEANDNLDPLLTMAKAYDQGVVKLNKSQKARLEQASDRLEAQITSEESRRSTQEAAEYDAMIDNQVSAFTDALMKNPRLDAREYYKQLGVSDEGLFRKLNTVQNAVLSAEENSGQTDAQTELAFRSELLQAGGDTKKRLDVISKYAGQGISAATVAQELQYNVEISNGSLVHNNDTVDMLREGYVSNIAVLENNEFNTDASGAAQTFAEGQYNLQMMQRLRGVDPNNISEINRIHSEVIDDVNRAVLNSYPNMVTNVAEADGEGGKKGNAEASGMQATLDAAQERQRQIMLENERKQQAIADEETVMSQEAVSEPEGGEEQPTDATMNRSGRRRDRTGEAEDGSFWDSVKGVFTAENPQAGRRAAARYGKTEAGSIEDITQEPEKQSEEAVSFHQTLINKFTDGEFTSNSLEVGLRVLEEDPKFKSGVESLAAKYDVPSASLLAVMDFETGGTFDPAIENAAGSGATGIIQFMPNTARSLGTTTEELSGMSRSEQLVYVEKYFDQFASKIRGGSVDDIYMAVLWPAAAGKPASYPIFRSGTQAYEQNRGLDKNGDGTVTKEEAASRVKAKFYGY